MDIPFTKQQFKTLLRAVWIAETVKNRYTATDEEVDTDIQNLEQYIYSLAKQAGCENCVTFDDTTHTYLPTTQLEQGMGAIQDMSEYNENIFWEKLEQGMMARDIHELYTDEQWASLSAEEADTLQEQLLERWQAEFVAHGVNRLRAVDITLKEDRKTKSVANKGGKSK